VSEKRLKEYISVLVAEAALTEDAQPEDVSAEADVESLADLKKYFIDLKSKVGSEYKIRKSNLEDVVAIFDSVIALSDDIDFDSGYASVRDAVLTAIKEE